MSRALLALVVLVLMVPGMAASATEEKDYRDDFGSGGYSGNDGSLDWSGSWAEFGDSSGAGGGLIHVGPENCSNNRCLHIEGAGVVIASYGITRSADLSMFETAELSFDIQVIPHSLLPTTTELRVQLHDGKGWTTIKTYPLSQPTSHHKALSVTEYIDASFKVRFVVMDVLNDLTGLLYNGYATIDRVEIVGTVAAPATTTTTAQPATTASTAPRPTTTVAPVTTIPKPSTDQTRPGDETDAAAPVTSSTSTSTSTTVATTTSTTQAPAAATAIPPATPPRSGLRDPGVGLMADYSGGMMGEMDMEPVEVLGAELEADFSLAVEAFEAARVWIAVLTLLIGAAIVSGMDHRRNRTLTRL